MVVERLTTADSLASVPAGFVIPLTPSEWALTRPDTHLTVISSGRLCARASLWWQHTPSLSGTLDAAPTDRVGIIGHYEAADSASAERLLESALETLNRQQCTVVLGPMDGSTWHSYRLVTDTAPGAGAAPEAPFFMEPFSSPEAAQQFEAAGFSPVARYFSARVQSLGSDEEGDAAERLANKGITLRSFSMARADDELARLYSVALDAFQKNAFYTPLSEQGFMELYRPIVPHIRPELVVLAERDDRTVGFGFGVPDLAQAQRGEKVDTVIVKTIAVQSDSQGLGLGGALTARVQHEARRLGYCRAIHALMHESNVSTRISRHQAIPMRRYALFGQRLR